MFIKYTKLVSQLFTTIWSQNDHVAVTAWLQAIGYSLMIALSVVLIIAVTVGVFFGPYKCHAIFIDKPKQLWYAELTKKEPDNPDLLKTMPKKIRTRQSIYWGVLLFVYIPIAIPTVLFLLSVITGGSL